MECQVLIFSSIKIKGEKKSREWTIEGTETAEYHGERSKDDRIDKGTNCLSLRHENGIYLKSARDFGDR